MKVVNAEVHEGRGVDVNEMRMGDGVLSFDPLVPKSGKQVPLTAHFMQGEVIAIMIVLFVV